MSEFTPITTQEEFNNAIKERLQREREKFADYETLKTQVSDQTKTIADLTKAADDLKAKYADFDQQLAERDNKIKGYETASVKTRIAREFGIPYELAERISGDTEEAIRADAQSLSGFLKQSAPSSPGKSGERTEHADSKTAAYQEMLSNLNI